jgi:pyruvate/2-oxoacid:ferredoxin oxidoreductase beta subunit
MSTATATYTPHQERLQTDQSSLVPRLRRLRDSSAVQSVFPELGIRRENFVVVSGIGCSGRFYYRTRPASIRFTAVRRGSPRVKAIRPDLEVWVATGDGMRSIGGITRFTCCAATLA